MSVLRNLVRVTVKRFKVTLYRTISSCTSLDEVRSEQEANVNLIGRCHFSLKGLAFFLVQTSLSCKIPQEGAAQKFDRKKGHERGEEGKRR